MYVRTKHDRGMPRGVPEGHIPWRTRRSAYGAGGLLPSGQSSLSCVRCRLSWYIGVMRRSVRVSLRTLCAIVRALAQCQATSQQPPPPSKVRSTIHHETPGYQWGG